MKQETIRKPILVLVGPTAIGKTDLSLALAHLHGCEIVSVDSMQVYKYLDIGTAKASVKERAEIPHHLIDIVEPDENYDAAMFAEDGLQAIHNIHKRNKVPLLTGGTGLYLQALQEGIFPGVPVDNDIRETLKQRWLVEGPSKLHEELCLYDSISGIRIHKNDTQRLLRALEIFYSSGKPWSEHIEEHKNQKKQIQFKNTLQIALTTDREKLYERINKRCELMITQGLESEVRNLLAKGYNQNLKCFSSIGYSHMISYINGLWPEEEMRRLLARDTRRYAKRQYTWFSKLKDLFWYDISEKEQILTTVNCWFTDSDLQQ